MNFMDNPLMSIVLFLPMVSYILLIISNMRNIAAFSAQQSIPVQKEVIDTMTPSIGNIAKEVTKKVKEEIKNDKK